jgi:hypothetical protein
MNIAQRLYANQMKMITNDINPSFFYQSIGLINSRKTMYPLYKTFYLKKKPRIPYQTNYVIENNKRFSSKMDDIMNKKVTPKINNIFLELEERIKNNKKKNRENKIRALTIENEKYTNRVMEQKARVLNAKYLNKLYTENHDKYLELLLRPMKIRANKMKKNQKSYNFRTRLPNISQTSTDGFYSKGRYKTDISSTNEQSNENSLELKEHKRHEIIHGRPNHNY